MFVIKVTYFLVCLSCLYFLVKVVSDFTLGGKRNAIFKFNLRDDNVVESFPLGQSY